MSQQEETKAIPPLRQGPKKRLRKPITLTLATPEKIRAYREQAVKEGLSLGGWLELAADARLERADRDYMWNHATEQEAGQ